MKEIVRLLLDNLSKRLAEKNISLKVSDSALDYLAEKSYDPEYGARPARRRIQDLVEDVITQMLLDGKIKESSVVTISKRGSELTIK